LRHSDTDALVIKDIKGTLGGASIKPPSEKVNILDGALMEARLPSGIWLGVIMRDGLISE
jgi:hypothetical protein